MPELRKLLNLTPIAHAVTLPNKYLKVLGLVRGDYLEVSLYDDETIAIRRHKSPAKR